MSGAARGRTRIIWLVLAALLVVVAAVEMRERARQRAELETPSGPQMVMPAPIEEIGAIEIAFEGNLHRFSRDDKGAWFYHGVHGGPQAVHEHIPDPAMSEKIAKVFGALGRARIERRLEMPENSDPFNVARPEMIILVYLSGQIEPRTRYAVGDLAPDDLSRYIHITGTRDVITIPDYQIRNLLSLLDTVSAQPSLPSASS